MTKITFGAADQAAFTTFAKLQVEGHKNDPEDLTDRDFVTLSEEAKKLATGRLTLTMDETGKDNGSVSSKKSRSAKDAAAALIEKRIEQLKKEIKAIQESALSEEEKEKLIQPKRDEIAQLTEQLERAKGLKKAGPMGGTPAGESGITGRKSLT